MAVIHVADVVQCREFIFEMWRNVILKQLWKEGHRIELKSTKDGRVLDIDNPNDVDEYYDIITGTLSTELREMMKKAWTLHCGFGACCDPANFHSEGAWKL